MELRVLQYFLAVAREQSISAAAESLHLSQPTLSTQLKALEEELGLGLFERTSRRVRLSREGELLLPSARALVEAEFALEAQARRCRELSRGKLDLAALAGSQGVHRLCKQSLGWTTYLP